MEQIITIAIYIHAFFGGIGLITGLGSATVKKGGDLHKKFGKLFTISMLISTIISIVITQMPNHKNSFLFAIGLFTIYLVLTGNRALSFKPHLKDKAANIDKVISGVMVIISLVMISYGMYGLLKGYTQFTLFAFFGIFGVILSGKDFYFYKNFKKNKKAWLLNHISHISGALIASITAFIVAGIGIGTLIAWILPSVIGSFYIAYWSRKYKPKKVSS